MGCGASSELKGRLISLEQQNNDLHKKMVDAEIEKHKAVTQKDMYETNFSTTKEELHAIKERQKAVEIRAAELQVGGCVTNCQLVLGSIGQYA